MEDQHGRPDSFSPRPRPQACENDGCVRPATAGERFCDTCGIERALFRRDERMSLLAPVPPGASGPQRTRIVR